MRTPTNKPFKGLKTFAAAAVLSFWLSLAGTASALPSQTYYGLFNGTVDRAVTTSTGYSLLTEVVYGRGATFSYGLYWDSSDTTVENNKSINVETRMDTYVDAETPWVSGSIRRIYGLYLADEIPLVNSGNISVTTVGGSDSSSNAHIHAATDTHAHGIFSDSTINNSGNITVKTNGDTTVLTYDNTANTRESSSAYISSYAYGIFHPLIHSRSIASNSGNITVTVNGGTATNDSSTSTRTTVSAHSSGIYSIDTVSNSGNITVAANGGKATSSSNANTYGYATAHATSRSDTNAYGLYSLSDVSTIGNIAVTADGGKAISTSKATAHANAYDNTYSYANAHSTSSTSASANGINSRLHASNNGNITVSAVGGTATSTSDVYADANAYASAHAVTNTNANATGIFSFGTVSDNGNITVTANGGKSTSLCNAYANTYVATDANADAGGIYSRGPVNNNSNITVIANGGTATSLNAAATITATITANANSNAYGIYSGKIIRNYGNIMVTANGGTAKSTRDAYAYADARGIFSSSLTSSGGNITVYNSGNITVTANGGTASGSSGAYANTDTRAYGIHLSGYNISLSNYGSIKAAADTAYEVYIDSDSNVTLLDNYTFTIDGDANIGSIYVSSSSNLHLNNAKLSVTTGSNFSWNTDYTLFKNDGSIHGSFSSVSAINPEVTVSYNNRGTIANSSDDTVSLNYTPQRSSALSAIQATSSAIHTANGQLDHRLLGHFLAYKELPKRRLYASSGMIMSDARPLVLPKREWFLTQYYAKGSQSDANYDSDSIGLVGGYQNIRGQRLYGAHFGYSRSNIDFNSAKQTDINQDNLFAGVHAMRQQGNITLRGQLSAYYAWFDYSAMTGANYNVMESADYNSYGITSKLLVGYLVKNHNQLWLPEVGLSYLWLHQQDFTTKAEGNSWDIAVGDVDEHQVSAVANLNWQTHRPLKEAVMTPKLNAGLRYLLTDNEQSINQQVSGSAPVSLRSEQDRLSATIGAALQLQRKQQSVELAYNGQYSEDSSISSLWLKFTSHF